VFPVGPIQAIFTAASHGVRMELGQRHAVAYRNGQPVPLCPFIKSECVGISALVTCVTSCSPDLSPALSIAHNPLATVAIPLGLLGDAAEEWQAMPVDGVTGGLSRVRLPSVGNGTRTFCRLY
jgi:hypothetical protein